MLKFIIQSNLIKNKTVDLNEVKFYIEIYFRQKIDLKKSIKFYYYYYYFNKKFNLFNKFNLDLESYFIEFNSKILNE